MRRVVRSIFLLVGDREEAEEAERREMQAKGGLLPVDRGSFFL